LADFEENGRAAIQMARVEDPAAYCRIVASLLPKQSEEVDYPLNGLNADELDAIRTTPLRALEAQLSLVRARRAAWTRASS
jgi:hypothetical protein